MEVLSGVLTGSAVNPHVGSMARDLDRPVRCGHLCLAIDPERFVGRDAFGARLDTLVAAIRAVPPREGFDAVRVPGEGGAAAGPIEIPDDLRAILDGLGFVLKPAVGPRASEDKPDEEGRGSCG